MQFKVHMFRGTIIGDDPEELKKRALRYRQIMDDQAIKAPEEMAAAFDAHAAKAETKTLDRPRITSKVYCS